MAVNSAFLAKVKTSLRVSANTFDSQISDLVEEAILDLTKTADIQTFTTEAGGYDALQYGAVVAYVSYKWFNDAKYFDVYNDMKQKMALSGTYRVVVDNDE
jgi:hypothetical protein